MQYALIDAAALPEALDWFEQYDPVMSCLFLEPLSADIEPVAPYLVQLEGNAPLQSELEKSTALWGLYLESSASLAQLRAHLRKYLQVQLPGHEERVMMRFYDPRVFFNLAQVLSDWQLHSLLGPIQLVSTNAQGAQDFAQRRESFAKDSFARHKWLCLEADQMAQLHQLQLNETVMIHLEQQFFDLAQSQPEAIAQLTQALTDRGLHDPMMLEKAIALYQQQESTDVHTFLAQHERLRQEDTDSEDLIALKHYFKQHLKEG